MDNYTVRIGTRRAKKPAYGLYGIPYRTVEDDGKTFMAGGQEPLCPDCCVGHLRWAEAGYVPWHRICDVCGSHWDLHPAMYIQWGNDAPWTGESRKGTIINVTQMDPDDLLPSGITHAEMLRLAIDAGTQPNGNREDQWIASACWFQRARCY